MNGSSAIIDFNSCKTVKSFKAHDNLFSELFLLFDDCSLCQYAENLQGTESNDNPEEEHGE